MLLRIYGDIWTPIHGWCDINSCNHYEKPSGIFSQIWITVWSVNSITGIYARKIKAHVGKKAYTWSL